jgi:methionyl-tRNA formyltransferase
MRLLFFGSGAFGLPSLQHLARTHEIAAVVSQPDRPAGRGGSLTPTPIAAWSAINLPVPLLKPDKVNTIAEVVRAFRADAWIVIAFGQKLGKALLDGVFAINLHASLLPRWRGAAPINAAILAGDRETGNSIITLADRMDAGEVLGQSRRGIDPLNTAGELHDLLAADGPMLIEQVLSSHRGNAVVRRVQDESLVTIAPKLSKADGWVDFSDAAEAARRRIHGLTPWPGVTVRFRTDPLKLTRAAVAPGTSDHKHGTISDPSQGLVACRGSLLQLMEVHPAGRKQMSWADFVRGHHVTAGEQLVGGRPQELRH